MARNDTFLVGLALIWLTATAPAAESELSKTEIVARCAEALGGYEEWERIQTLELSGSSTSFGIRRSFLEQRKRPNLYRYFFYEGPAEALLAFDGKMAWLKKQFLLQTKGNWPMPAEHDHGEWIEIDSEFGFPFLAHPERKLQLQFRGATDLDGEPCYEFEIGYPNGRLERWYVSSDSFLPFARTREIVYVGFPDEMRIFYSDYRDVAGVMIPHRVEWEFGNEYRVAEVEMVRVNTELDDQLFGMPPPAGMEILRFLAGRFDVLVRTPLGAAPGFHETTSVSVIRPDFHDALLEENISITSATGFPLQIRRLYSFDRFRDEFRIAHFDNSTAHLDILEGTFDGKRLVVSDVASGTGRAVYDKVYQTRMIFYDIAESGFSLDVEFSIDGGETWVPERQLIYSRSLPSDFGGDLEDLDPVE